MKRTVVLNVVGLSESLLGAAMPRITEFVKAGAKAAITPAFPAVTCTAQANYLTGLPPERHGVVANGWYNRELSEVHFWKQSNHLVRGRKLWDELRELHPNFTCAKLFWWFNMYSTADYSITPRPAYPADGRKVFDIYTWPYSIREEIKRDLGEFPFATFWGPAAGRTTGAGSADAATRWIAESAKWIENRHSPSLSLVYLPHLDYNLQRLGPAHADIPRDARLADTIVGELIAFFQKRAVEVILLSEYGITPADLPVQINRLLRSQGWLTVKNELGLEMPDFGASKAFAVSDHQIAHIYLNDSSIKNEVRRILEEEPGISKVLDSPEKTACGIDHPRSGDLIAVANENAWFTYHYWFEDRLAPDFARCVDIHRKPGYDPLELFLDPKIKAVKLKILRRLLQKKLGFRMLMDVIPLDATLVKGSHGAPTASALHQPFLSTARADLLHQTRLDSLDVYHVIKRHLLY